MGCRKFLCVYDMRIVLLKWNSETLIKWLSEQFWRCCSCVYVLIETTRALQCVCVCVLKEIESSKLKQNKFEVFYFTCNESKINKKFHFCTFSPYSNLYTFIYSLIYKYSFIIYSPNYFFCGIQRNSEGTT